MTAFARTLEVPHETIREIAVGALLHDVGKARVPDEILNKPGKLTDAEFDRMKSHVVQSKIILQATPGISPIALDVAAQHHERFDGSGYPNKLAGQGISLYGRMGAIVDVYDAITSDRVYHKGMAPTEALRKLLDWSANHFEPRLVKAFIRSVGIYPTGALVRLESKRLAVVQAQHADKPMQPTVKVIFHTAGHYLRPEDVDLRRSQDRIVGHEDFAAWNIDALRWLPQYARSGHEAWLLAVERRFPVGVTPISLGSNSDFPWERRESRSCRPPRCASAGMRTPSSRLASLLQGPSKPKRLPVGATQVAIPRSIRRDRLQRLVQLEPA